jgi:carbon starvation protein CstA
LRWIRSSLSVALILIAFVPALVIPIILTDGQFPPQSFQDVYWRFFGVIVILDALATIALPVATLIVRGQHKHDTPAPGPTASSPKALSITLTGVAATWVTDQAKASSKTADQVVAALIAAARKK